MNTNKPLAMALMMAMQDQSFGANNPTKPKQCPAVGELFNACVEYYRATKGLRVKERRLHHSDLRKLRYQLGLSAKDLNGCKQSAQRYLIKLGELK